MRNNLRSTKTAAQHDFTRKNGVWRVTDPESTHWYNSLPTKTIIMRGQSGQYYQVSVDADREYLGFTLDQKTPMTIGYDKKSKSVYLDVDEEAFLNGEDIFFRGETAKEDDTTDKE
jgi:hypothetical protein